MCHTLKGLRLNKASNGNVNWYYIDNSIWHNSHKSKWNFKNYHLTKFNWSYLSNKCVHGNTLDFPTIIKYFDIFLKPNNPNRNDTGQFFQTLVLNRQFPCITSCMCVNPFALQNLKQGNCFEPKVLLVSKKEVEAF